MRTAARAAALRRIVAHDKRALKSAIARAEDVARRELDLTRHLVEHRWAVLGASFALGLWLGAKSD